MVKARKLAPIDDPEVTDYLAALGAQLTQANPGAARVEFEFFAIRDHTVTFGESTTNEMCFLVGFAADRASMSGCVVGNFPGAPDGSAPPG